MHQFAGYARLAPAAMMEGGRWEGRGEGGGKRGGGGVIPKLIHAPFGVNKSPTDLLMGRPSPHTTKDIVYKGT